jgi:hypothetical protein
MTGFRVTSTALTNALLLCEAITASSKPDHRVD